MNCSDTPPEKRLRRLCASRRSRWSRYLAVSPIHNLRTTPPSGRISFIGSPDIIVDKTRLDFASSQWSGFDIRDLPSREVGERMSKPKLHYPLIFASGFLILTFAKNPAARRCEC